MNHGKHGNHTMIMLRMMITVPRNMVAMPSSWHDHDKITAWQPCLSNPGSHSGVFYQFLISTHEVKEIERLYAVHYQVLISLIVCPPFDRYI